MSISCAKHIKTPYRGYSPCAACELEYKDAEIASLKSEVERMKAQVLTLQTEYVRQNPFVDPQDEIDELRREVERLEAERDHARNEFVELAKLLLPAPGEPTIDGDKIVTPLSDSPLLRRMTELMITALKSGPGNFHTVTFQTTKDGQEYSLTIQREGGKTPAQKIAELISEVERLRVQNESINDLSLRRVAALKEIEAMVVPKEDREIRDLSWLLDDIKGAIEKLQVDVKLGRMVRAMPPRSRLCRGIPEEGDRRDWYCFWGNDDRAASEGDTPEEALEKAVVKP